MVVFNTRWTRVCNMVRVIWCTARQVEVGFSWKLSLLVLFFGIDLFVLTQAAILHQIPVCELTALI